MTASSIPIHVLDGARLTPWLKTQSDPVRNWVAAQQFDASAGSLCMVPDAKGRVECVLAGLGDQPGLYTLAGLPTQLPAGRYRLEGLDDADQAEQLCLGIELGRYRFDRYVQSEVADVRIDADALTDSVRSLRDAVYQVRDLVNTPTEDMGPEALSSTLAELAAAHGATCSEWVGDELLENDCPAIHAVGRAAHGDRQPRLTRLDHGHADHPRVVIVGKGVCFDTGGLNIKGGVGMRSMKKDMGGAAHAIALAGLILRAQLPIRLTVLLPIVENAISSNAYRPGDVVASRAGLSIEIGNTDAEGRVILADALTLGSELEPDLMIDFATLTGAARIALGPDLPPLFGRVDQTVNALVSASERVSDRLWPMPLYEPYREFLNSSIADLCNNASTPMGGCMTAALFLDRFVAEKIDWCHIDTFAWTHKSGPGRSEGGDALGCRAVFAYLCDRYPR